MKMLQGTEAMVFSYAYYQVSDFDGMAGFFQHLEKNGLFIIDAINLKKKELTGAFVQEYPKGHRNPMARFPGAKQVLGGAEIKSDILKIDTKTKGGLKMLRELLEGTLGATIKFKKEEFKDVMNLMRVR